MFLTDSMVQRGKGGKKELVERELEEGNIGKLNTNVTYFMTLLQTSPF